MERKRRDGGKADAREMQRLGGERGRVEDEKWWNPLRGFHPTSGNPPCTINGNPINGVGHECH